MSEILPYDDNARLALFWLLNPETLPLASLSEDVQRLVAALAAKLPLRGLSKETEALIRAQEREAAEIDRAREIASFNRAKQRAVDLEEQEFSELLASEDGRTSLVERFASDALTTDALDDIDEHEPLIADFINRDTLCRIFGPPKSLKSFIALSMAAAIGTGERWFGYRVTQMPVLYVVAEGARGIKDRVRSWEQMHGRKMTGVTFYPKAVQIGDANHMRQLIAYARMGGYGFVIFDTQARCTVGHEENSNSEMGKIVARLDKLREWTQAGVMLVHHSGNETGRARGATAILAAVDSEFEVQREKDTTKVKVITRAQKDMKEAPDLALEGLEIGDSLAFRAQGAFTAGPAKVEITETQARVLRVVVQSGSIGLSPTNIGKQVGKERGSLTSTLSALADKKGCIEKVSSTGRYAATSAGRRQLEAYDQQQAEQAREQEYAQDELGHGS